ncbi:hypothetical protein HYC85_014092 [Camellia sinensis]|uniref:Uncharacterized protein n=1 Tax=Camellia sinensis TaxID=4442 RepID=A0A7J7H6K4_CAMSI|nr:hypothetical protein HYC85_014092 [Camellia sinensis]
MRMHYNRAKNTKQRRTSSTYRWININLNYYIYNPITNQFTGLDFIIVCGRQLVSVVNLAYDHSKLLHYKVVCVYRSDALAGYFEIEIYSSKTGLWKPSSDPFIADINFEHGIGVWGVNSLYFNVDEERIGTMPMPPISDDWKQDKKLSYFGEFGDHLYLIEIYNPPFT